MLESHKWIAVFLLMTLPLGIGLCFKQFQFLIFTELKAMAVITFGFALTCLLLSFLWLVQKRPIADIWRMQTPLVVDIPNMYSSDRFYSHEFETRRTFNQVKPHLDIVTIDKPPEYQDAIVNSKPISWILLRDQAKSEAHYVIQKVTNHISDGNFDSSRSRSLSNQDQLTDGKKSICLHEQIIDVSTLELKSQFIFEEQRKCSVCTQKINSTIDCTINMSNFVTDVDTGGHPAAVKSDPIANKPLLGVIPQNIDNCHANSFKRYNLSSDQTDMISTQLFDENNHQRHQSSQHEAHDQLCQHVYGLNDHQTKPQLCMVSHLNDETKKRHLPEICSTIIDCDQASDHRCSLRLLDVKNLLLEDSMPPSYDSDLVQCHLMQNRAYIGPLQA